MQTNRGLNVRWHGSNQYRIPMAAGARPASLTRILPSKAKAQARRRRLIGVLAGEHELSESVTRGVAWLTQRQNDDGRWRDDEFTGTGFPNHRYLRYHMYAHYFPLMALGRFRRRIARGAEMPNSIMAPLRVHCSML